MEYSYSRLAASLVSSIVVVILLLTLVLSSQVAVALLPVLGVGGIYGEIESFDGNDGTVYPEYTDGIGSPVATDTESCEQIPMLVIELEDGTVENFDIRKDIELPHLTDRWMSIRIEQEDTGQIQLDSLQIYTTQLAADSLLIRNIELEESNFGGKFGPNSGEFVLEGGQDTGALTPGIEASGVEAWAHAVTGDGITIEDTAGGLGIGIELEFPTTSQISDFYDNRLGYDGAPVDNREDYFGCTPTEQFN